MIETGHLLLAKRMIETGHIRPPGMFQICLGIAWGQPATSEAMIYMRNLLPPGCTWFAFGISLHQFPMAAQAVILGGHLRVGLEDNLYLGRGVLSQGNAPLVQRAVDIVRNLDREVATPAQAREILAIGQLALHRETLADLSEGRAGDEVERAPTNGIKCTGRCPTATCVCSIY